MLKFHKDISINTAVSRRHSLKSVAPKLVVRKTLLACF